MSLLIPWFQTTPSRLSFLPISSSPSPPPVNTNRIGSFQNEDLENYEAAGLKDTPVEQDGDAPVKEQSRISEEIFQNGEYETSGSGYSFLVKVAIALGVAVTATIISAGFKQPVGSSFGFQRLAEDSSSSVLSATPVGFTFKAFGYRIVLPEYTPGGVCISDMVPFYLGKAFRQTGASDDVCSKLGISKEKAASITRVVQRYGNFIGFVERVSIGVRNPTAFLAGAMGISPECFFAGVCFGGLVTLPLQLGIGFLLRERPVFALATVATTVGVWTVFPYAVAASTALFLFLRRRYFT
ncbi:uncharacterized protein LOC100261941 isoform X5 [Vitis vinifera]|uniref:uncharacterized protein LOC100261941 isoform X5 n=1 Tax=Vitis vinifera TaxID=29760 RepID=UPI0028831E12|nr:uncharacterized protein LOC100261941 isoform X5 [Vitis vinifera]